MKKQKFCMIIALCNILCSSCNYSGSLIKTKTISRHYVLKNGHASLRADDYGTEYIIEKNGDLPVFSYYCDFDSFYYYESMDATVKTYHQGFLDYINISEDVSYFDFHYNGECNYKITTLDEEKTFEMSGVYSFTAEDYIKIQYINETPGYAITRFGMEQNGIGYEKITFLQTSIKIQIDEKDTIVYFWFYDSILHPSPWGEK